MSIVAPVARSRNRHFASEQKGLQREAPGHKMPRPPRRRTPAAARAPRPAGAQAGRTSTEPSGEHFERRVIALLNGVGYTPTPPEERPAAFSFLPDQCLFWAIP